MEFVKRIKFNDSDLLTYDDFTNILHARSPNERADIISSKFKNYCFIYHELIFTLDVQNVVFFEDNSNISTVLINNITLFLSSSKNALKDEHHKALLYEFKKEYDTICENSYVKKFIEQITQAITLKTLVFTANKNEVHFRNGFINLIDGSFSKRIIGKHYVKDFINRNYIKPSDEKVETVMNIFGKIYPKKEDLETILLILGSALTGNATINQKILFLLGLGSAGKSTILKITELSLDCYFFKLDSSAFSIKNQNKDKTFSSFYYNKSCRVVWINEPEDTKFDASIFKQFAEGEMEGKLLYANGIHKFNHNALPILTANTMPNINMDSGVKRRICSYNHTSVFTEDVEKVDNKTVFLAEKNLYSRFSDENLLDAWVHILTQHAMKWNKSNCKNIELPLSFTESTDIIISVNDKIQDFIEAKLEVTNDKNDAVSKQNLLDAYSEFQKNSHLSIQQLITLLKEKNISYDKGKRFSGEARGGFIGIRLKDSFDEMETDLTIMENLEREEAKNKKLEQENRTLLKELEKLKAEFEQLKNSSVAKNPEDYITVGKKKETHIIAPDEIDENKINDIVVKPKQPKNKLKSDTKKFVENIF
jgi:hypothetical protein